jgi:phosphate transport system protein
MPTNARHISKQYERELKALREKILAMGNRLVDMIDQTMQALVERDSDLAREMIEFDHEINRLEVEIDEMSLNIIALRQPAASDLRFITLALKVTTDLERVGDLCVNIAERTLELNKEPQLTQVTARDDVVDNLNEQVFRELLTFMLEDPKTITRATRLTFISKYLERMADHATNIAEMVIFMVKGKDIRHMSIIEEKNKGEKKK